MKSENPVDLDELELELIDYGGEEIFRDEDDDVIVIYGEYTAFGQIQQFIEENNYQLVSGGFERIPNVDLKNVPEEDRVELNKLIERLEEDDDVQNVYHTLQL